MTAPIIFIILDGLRYDTARECLGYAEALVAAKDAQVYRLHSQLPSLSRPLYETLMTGMPPVQHGVVGNGVVRRSTQPSVFAHARKKGLVTAAAAYHWFSELYNEAPFNPAHRLTERPDALIQHGLFYWSDEYPDDHLFADADALLTRAKPDFLLVHSMGIDDTGHKHGGTSTAYRNAVRQASALLSLYLPQWREKGYTIIVNSDHGMGDDGNHGGPSDSETLVPLYAIGADRFTLDADLKIHQTEIAGTLCRLLGIDDPKMAFAPGLLR